MSGIIDRQNSLEHKVTESAIFTFYQLVQMDVKESHVKQQHLEGLNCYSKWYLPAPDIVTN